MLPEHKWEIAVNAGSYYPSLTTNFPSRDIGLGHDNDYLGMVFFAYSYHIDELDDKDLIGRRLFSLELILNGALRLSWGDADTVPIKFTEFSLLKGGHRGSVYAQSIEENPFSSNPEIDANIPSWAHPKTNFSAYLIHLSKSDEDLRSLIFLIGLISRNSALENILTWGTLYKIYDSVKFYSKENSIDIDTLIDSKVINSVTASCNNMSVIGLNARHGAKAESKPPKNIITVLSEATQVVMDMASKFVRTYIAQKYP